MGGTYQQGTEAVPGYRLDRFLGRGGFGEVWRVSGPGGVRSALKIISMSGKHAQKEFRAVIAVKNLHHPHLVPIQGIWFRNAHGYLIDDAALTGSVGIPAASLPPDLRPAEMLVLMGLCDESLFDRLEKARRTGLYGIPVEELLDYMDEAAKAIDYLNTPRHDLGDGTPVGIQHCDIKPQNIMLVGGSVQVCDFGLARVLHNQAVRAVSADGGAATLAYAAPEVLAGRGTTAWTDQYSLAITYVELRTGTFPFPEDSASYQLMKIHVEGRLDLSRLPPSEAAVIARATKHLNPAERFKSCAEFVRALRRAIGIDVIGAGPPDDETGLPPQVGSATLQPGSNIGHGVILEKHQHTGSGEDVWFARIGHQELAVVVRELTRGAPDVDLSAMRLTGHTLKENEERLRELFLREFTDYWMLDARGQAVSDDSRMRELLQKHLGARLVVSGRRADKNMLQRIEESKGQGVPLDELLRYTFQVATAVDFLNQERKWEGKSVRILHMNVRPVNILYSANRSDVRLGNFGHVRLVDGDVATLPEGVAMAHTFLAPEILYNNTLSRWSDQYSLALTYLHLRLGRMPFEVSHGTTTILDDLRGGNLHFGPLNPRESQVIRRATDIHYQNRFGSCLEFFRELVAATGVDPQFPTDVDPNSGPMSMPGARISDGFPFHETPRTSQRTTDSIRRSSHLTAPHHRSPVRRMLVGTLVVLAMVGLAIGGLLLLPPLPKPPGGTGDLASGSGLPAIGSTAGRTAAPGPTASPGPTAVEPTTPLPSGVAPTVTAPTSAPVTTREPTPVPTGPPPFPLLDEFRTWLSDGRSLGELSPGWREAGQWAKLRERRPTAAKDLQTKLEAIAKSLQQPLDGPVLQESALAAFRREADLWEAASKAAPPGPAEPLAAARKGLLEAHDRRLETILKGETLPSYDTLGKHLAWARDHGRTSPWLRLGLVECRRELPDRKWLTDEQTTAILAETAAPKDAPWADYRAYLLLRQAESGPSPGDPQAVVRDVRAAFDLTVPADTTPPAGRGLLEGRLSPARSAWAAQRLLAAAKGVRFDRRPTGRLAEASAKPRFESPETAAAVDDALRLAQAIGPQRFVFPEVALRWTAAAFERRPPQGAAAASLAERARLPDGLPVEPPPVDELLLCRAIVAEGLSRPSVPTAAWVAVRRGWELLLLDETPDRPFDPAYLTKLKAEWLDPPFAELQDPKQLPTDPAARQAAAAVPAARAELFLRTHPRSKDPTWGKLVEELGISVALDPQPDYLALRAYCRLHTVPADYEAAQAELETARKGNPKSLWVLFASGEYWIRKSETLSKSDGAAALREAEPLYQEAVTVAQQMQDGRADWWRAQALIRRGICFLHLSLIDPAATARALADAEEAGRIWPSSADAWMVQGLALYDQATAEARPIRTLRPLFARAETAFSEASKLDPAWRTAEYRLARTRLHEQYLLTEPDRRAGILEQAVLELVDDVQDFPDALFWRGIGRRMLNRLEEAERDLTASAAQDHLYKLFAQRELISVRVARTGAPQLRDLTDLETALKDAKGNPRRVLLLDWLNYAIVLARDEDWNDGDPPCVLMRIEPKLKELSLEFPDTAIQWMKAGAFEATCRHRRASKYFTAALLGEIREKRAGVSEDARKRLDAVRLESKFAAGAFERWLDSGIRIPAEDRPALQQQAGRLWAGVGLACFISLQTFGTDRESDWNAVASEALQAYEKSGKLAPDDPERPIWLRDHLSVLLSRLPKLAADDPQRPKMQTAALELIAAARKVLEKFPNAAVKSRIDEWEKLLKN